MAGVQFAANTVDVATLLIDRVHISIEHVLAPAHKDADLRENPQLVALNIQLVLSVDSAVHFKRGFIPALLSGVIYGANFMAHVFSRVRVVLTF